MAPVSNSITDIPIQLDRLHIITFRCVTSISLIVGIKIDKNIALIIFMFPELIGFLKPIEKGILEFNISKMRSICLMK